MALMSCWQHLCVNIGNGVCFPFRISIKENIDSIRLQKQLSEKNVSLAVLQEKFNNLHEVARHFSRVSLLDKSDKLLLIVICCVSSCQAYENQLEEVNVLLSWKPDEDMTN